MHASIGNRIIAARARIVAGFSSGNWEELGLITGMAERITQHPRLLRSLAWGDEDYAGNVLTTIRQMVESDPKILDVIESYVDSNFPGESTYISAKPRERRITFSPNVFAVPDFDVETDLVAIMMPFAMDFDQVSEAVKQAAVSCNMRSLRADDVWDESVIIQDVFNLIFRANVVVVDCTGRNSNVMYETGIAHTLGKHVIPIAQSLDDVPFDMRHHRALKYLPNAQGLTTLSIDLAKRLYQISL